MEYLDTADAVSNNDETLQIEESNFSLNDLIKQRHSMPRPGTPGK